jgi:hypothetical protein
MEDLSGPGAWIECGGQFCARPKSVRRQLWLQHIVTICLISECGSRQPIIRACQDWHQHF